MRKIALILAMLLIPCVSFAGLLGSSSSTTPVSKEYKQQLMGSPVYIQIFKEERTLDLYVKMGEQYQLLDSYKICKYSGGLGPKQRQGDFKSPEGFYSVQRNQLKPDSRYYKAINIGFPNAYDRAHGYEGKYLMIHGGFFTEHNAVGNQRCRSIHHVGVPGNTRQRLFNPFHLTNRNFELTANVRIRTRCQRYRFHAAG